MNIGIATTSYGSISNEPINILKKKNYNLVFNNTKKVLTEEWIINNFSNCDAIIAGTEIYSSKILSHLKNLKVISRLGVGIDNIDKTSSDEHNIKIFVVSTTPDISVAELVVTYILSLSRQVPKQYFDMKHNKKWHKHMGSLVSEKTLGIVGLGRVGKKLVNLVKGFNMKILAYDIYPDHNFAIDQNLRFVNFDTLVESSDFISIHIDGNKSNDNIFNLETFNKMKDNSIIINTSRGSIINEDDLYYALKNNIIHSAALDVFKEEPYKGNLLNLDNIIMTPHIGSYAKEIRFKMEIEASNNIVNFFNT